jgi:hypothetical protein
MCGSDLSPYCGNPLIHLQWPQPWPLLWPLVLDRALLQIAVARHREVENNRLAAQVLFFVRLNKRTTTADCKKCIVSCVWEFLFAARWPGRPPSNQLKQSGVYI